MAQKTVVTLIDDLDGSEADETVSFGLDGTTYEVDLTSAHAGELRSALTNYISNARKVGRKTGTAGPRTTVSNSSEIRAWAKSQGLNVPERGRIPQTVREAWDAR